MRILEMYFMNIYLKCDYKTYRKHPGIEMGMHKDYMRQMRSEHCTRCTNRSIGMGNSHMDNSPKRSYNKLSLKKINYLYKTLIATLKMLP
jgi:hypothetical protein